MNFIEFDNFGWNVLTLSFFATIVFSLLGVFYLWRQFTEIWSNKSGKSVSVTWICYFLFGYIATLFYGVHKDSLALVISAALRIPISALVLFGLWKFKGFKKIDQGIFFGSIVLMIAMIFSSEKVWFYLFFSFGSVISLATQPIEIWKNKSSGVVVIKVFVIYAISCLFWIPYAFITRNWALEFIVFSFFVISIATIILWFRYREEE